MQKKRSPKKPSAGRPEGITAITVCGYKSLYKEHRIEIRPLTILAGANSSGKSSIMQPLLLLRQTLEAAYDPGALLLDGSNVRFTSVDQFMSKVSKTQCSDALDVGVEVGGRTTVTTRFTRGGRGAKGLDVECMTYADPEGHISLRPGMSHEDIRSSPHPGIVRMAEIWSEMLKEDVEFSVAPNRCFLGFRARRRTKKPAHLGPGFFVASPSEVIEPHIRELIHLAGLRGNPMRTYPSSGAVGPTFSGTFEHYVASVIARWRAQRSEKLKTLGRTLEFLGLTWKVEAQPIDDTQVALRVGRLSHGAKGGARDLVSIADVGFGVSQALPVVVALLVAQPGQMVYLEQPEIHLHPRAQRKMARALADAANRGVRVVAETHSSLLLRGVQTLVAKGDISPDKVKLHWFRRDPETGETEIHTGKLDERGRFGDWPEDFDDVALAAEGEYLDAAGSRLGR